MNEGQLASYGYKVKHASFRDINNKNNHPQFMDEVYGTVEDKYTLECHILGSIAGVLVDNGGGSKNYQTANDVRFDDDFWSSEGDGRLFEDITDSTKIRLGFRATETRYDFRDQRVETVDYDNSITVGSTRQRHHQQTEKFST